MYLQSNRNALPRILALTKAQDEKVHLLHTIVTKWVPIYELGVRTFSLKHYLNIHRFIFCDPESHLH